MGCGADRRQREEQWPQDGLGGEEQRKLHPDLAIAQAPLLTHPKSLLFRCPIAPTWDVRSTADDGRAMGCVSVVRLPLRPPVLPPASSKMLIQAWLISTS